MKEKKKEQKRIYVSVVSGFCLVYSNTSTRKIVTANHMMAELKLLGIRIQPIILEFKEQLMYYADMDFVDMCYALCDY